MTTENPFKDPEYWEAQEADPDEQAWREPPPEEEEEPPGYEDSWLDAAYEDRFDIGYEPEWEYGY